MALKAKQQLIIESGRADAHYWRDLWSYRELFGVLAWRDLAIRYKETVFGVLWALGRPLLTMLVLSIVFGKFANLPSDGNVPYPLLVLAGMLVWNFFSAGVTDAAGSLIKDSSLITKVYFPRMIVPAASVVVTFVDFLISFAILAILMIWYRFRARLANHFSAVLRIACILGEPRTWPLGHGIEYQISRFSVGGSISCPIWFVYFAGRLQFEHRTRTMAFDFFPESGRRYHRRLSLVHIWWTRSNLLAWGLLEHHCDRVFPVVWCSPVQESGKTVC